MEDRPPDHQRDKAGGVGHQRQGHRRENRPDEKPGSSPTQARRGAIAERTGNGIGDDRSKDADNGRDGQVRELIGRTESGNLRRQEDLADRQNAQPDDKVRQRQKHLKPCIDRFGRHLEGLYLVQIVRYSKLSRRIGHSYTFLSSIQKAESVPIILPAYRISVNSDEKL